MIRGSPSIMYGPNGNAATEIALRAAEAYAAQVGDQPRTLEHVADNPPKS